MSSPDTQPTRPGHAELPSPASDAARLWVRVVRAVGVAALLVVMQLASYLVAGTIMEVVTRSDVASINDLAPSDSLRIALLALGQSVFAVAVIMLAVRARRAGWARSTASLSIRQGVLLLAPVLVLFVVVPAIAQLSTEGSLVSGRLALWGIIGIVILSCAVGIAEEIGFRYLVLDVAGGQQAPWSAIIISSLLFGVLHLSSTSSGVVANAVAVTCAVGIPFAVVRIMGAPIIALAMVHAANDIFALLHLGGFDLSRDVQAGEIGFLIAGSALLATGYLVALARTRARQSGELSLHRE